MAVMDITIEQIRKKGKKMGLTYMQSLSLYLFEEILYQVSRSQLKDQLWLKLEEFHLYKKQKKKMPNRIVYYMKDISYEKLGQAVEAMLQQKKANGLQMGWKLLFFDEQIEIVLDIRIEQVELPFKMIVRPVWQREQFSEKETYRSIFRENREITYQSYPMELNLAECFYMILDRLELIGSMEPYHVVCRILSDHAVDGRRFYLDLKELLEKRNLASAHRRWETVLGYAGYPYMEKRWNKEREWQKSDMTWHVLLEWMDRFFTPVWEAIQKDTIFFGDWMPHLGRYLD